MLSLFMGRMEKLDIRLVITAHRRQPRSFKRYQATLLVLDKCVRACVSRARARACLSLVASAHARVCLPVSMRLRASACEFVSVRVLLCVVQADENSSGADGSGTLFNPPVSQDWGTVRNFRHAVRAIPFVACRPVAAV